MHTCSLECSHLDSLNNWNVPRGDWSNDLKIHRLKYIPVFMISNPVKFGQRWSTTARSLCLKCHGSPTYPSERSNPINHPNYSTSASPPFLLSYLISNISILWYLCRNLLVVFHHIYLVFIILIPWYLCQSNFIIFTLPFHWSPMFQDLGRIL